jgi:wyosine [tRNA(Phe)-imidazoG37] synthetase (radical SAM superfamily)
VDPKILIQEIRAFLSSSQHIDYITFSGSGEPTLNKDIGTIIRQIRQETSIPIALLTNSTLLHLSEVRQELLPIDLILPSLDAVDKKVFQTINQPHPGIQVQQIIDGLKQFRREFQGQMWLEVFIVHGINDHEEELDNIYRTVKEIKPDKVQLNSLDRPPAFEDVAPVSLDTLEKIRSDWSDLPVEIVKRIQRRREIASFSRNLENSIMNTIRRRPLTIEDLMDLTGKNRLEIFKYLDILEKERKILTKIIGGKIFFTVPQ